MAVDPIRHERVREALKKASLDALVCGSPSRVLLLTGYWPVMGNTVAVFTASGEVRLVIPEDEAPLAEKTSSARRTTYKPALLDKLISLDEALEDPLRSVLKDMGLEGKTIGTEEQLHMQPASYASSVQFQCSLANLLRSMDLKLRLTSCEELVQALAAVRTPAELTCLRRSAQVARAGFARAAESIAAGVRECDVAAEAGAAFERSPEAEGLQRWYGSYWCMSGPNSAEASGAFALTRPRVLRAGDLVLVHANTCADGYWTDITRTFAVGAPEKRQAEMRRAIEEARAAALATIKPGVHARDVDEAARQVMEKHGLGKEFKHSTGHGVGLAAANPNARPRIHPKSPDVLEEGMTFNVEPAAYFDGYGGMRHCDVVAVTAGGVEVLTDF